MCNSCAQPVHSLLKSSGREYILYAGCMPQKVSPRKTTTLYTSSTHSSTPTLSTYIPRISNLLGRQLSTLYTGPINITTRYINK
jgi:hypothetical protein